MQKLNQTAFTKSFNDDQIPWVGLQTHKDPYSMDWEYLLCAFSKHHQHTLVLPPSRTITTKLWSTPPSSGDLSRARCSCRVRCRPWIKYLPAWQKAVACLPWWCSRTLSSVWINFCSRAAIFVFFSPTVSPRQKLTRVYVRLWYTKVTGQEMLGRS